MSGDAAGDGDGRVYRTVTASARVTEGRITVCRVGVRPVALTRLRGRVIAFRNLCPHAGSPLSGGTLARDAITCPRHGWRFELSTGACRDQPLYSLTFFDAFERDGQVHVEDPGDPTD